MWAALPVVVNALLSGALRDGVVAALYKEIFSSHVTGARCALPSVLLQLQSSALSDTTKVSDSFPKSYTSPYPLCHF